MTRAAVIPAVPFRPTLTSTSDERMSVMSVMPDTGFEPTMAMALAATVVNKKAITKTISTATIVCSQLFNRPNWKKTSTQMSVAQRIVRMVFIVRSCCVRSGALVAAFLPPSSDTARPIAWRMMPA